MEAVRKSFPTISKPQAELTCLAAEAVRICSLPNWWHEKSGGADYIYQSLVGERVWLYKRWDHSVTTAQREVERAIEEKNRHMALGAAGAFWKVQERFGATKQAEFLLNIAESIGHELASRLCKVHLSAKSALSSDNNFLSQAAWMMAGGVSPIAEKVVQVTEDECEALLDQARERWKNPQPIPHWCLDGTHSAGQDPRFMGCFFEMYAVCRAFSYYGRVDPSDEWLPEFCCYDGLIIDGSDAAGGS